MHVYFWLLVVAAMLSLARAEHESTTDAEKEEQLAFEKGYFHADYETLKARVAEYIIRGSAMNASPMVIARADYLRSILAQTEERMRRMQWSLGVRGYWQFGLVGLLIASILALCWICSFALAMSCCHPSLEYMRVLARNAAELDDEGLARWVAVHTIGALAEGMEKRSNITLQDKLRTLRICLRLIAMHRTTPFSDTTLASICVCLDAAVMLNQTLNVNGLIYEELVDDENALSFLFDALKTPSDYRWRIAVLAVTIFEFAPAPLRVSLIVRHYTQLPEAFGICLAMNDEFFYCFLMVREYTGILATSSLLDTLLSIVKGAPDSIDDFVHAQSCEAMTGVLANMMTTAPDLFEHLLGHGVLLALIRGFSDNHTHPLIHSSFHALPNFRAIVAAVPEWEPTVKRIADSATADNAVVQMGKGIRQRNTRRSVVYTLEEDW